MIWKKVQSIIIMRTDNYDNTYILDRERQAEKYHMQAKLHEINQAEVNHWMNGTGKPSWELTLGNPKYGV